MHRNQAAIYDLFNGWAKCYGPVYTVWFGVVLPTFRIKKIILQLKIRKRQKLIKNKIYKKQKFFFAIKKSKN
jgi:hypothetical protein